MCKKTILMDFIDLDIIECYGENKHDISEISKIISKLTTYL